jgi:peptide methionine sulfoxide reductase MsrA
LKPKRSLKSALFNAVLASRIGSALYLAHGGTLWNGGANDIGQAYRRFIFSENARHHTAVLHACIQ